jgi:hypothetical protein
MREVSLSVEECKRKGEGDCTGVCRRGPHA